MFPINYLQKKVKTVPVNCRFDILRQASGLSIVHRLHCSCLVLGI